MAFSKALLSSPVLGARVAAPRPAACPARQAPAQRLERLRVRAEDPNAPDPSAIKSDVLDCANLPIPPHRAANGPGSAQRAAPGRACPAVRHAMHQLPHLRRPSLLVPQNVPSRPPAGSALRLSLHSAGGAGSPCPAVLLHRRWFGYLVAGRQRSVAPAPQSLTLGMCYRRSSARAGRYPI